MREIIKCPKCDHNTYVNSEHDCTPNTERNYIPGFCKMGAAVIMGAFDIINTTHLLKEIDRLNEIIKWAENDQYIIPAFSIIYKYSESKIRFTLIHKANIAILKLK